MITLVFAANEDCSKAREPGDEGHWFDMKSWMMVYLCISFSQIFRGQVQANLDRRFEAQEITY